MGDNIPRESTSKKLDRGARAYCFRSEFFSLCFGFGIESLRFCFGPVTPTLVFERRGSFLGIYFYRIRFWKKLNFGCHLKNLGRAPLLSVYQSTLSG